MTGCYGVWGVREEVRIITRCYRVWGVRGGVMHIAYHTEKLSFLFLISI